MQGRMELAESGKDSGKRRYLNNPPRYFVLLISVLFFNGYALHSRENDRPVSVTIAGEAQGAPLEFVDDDGRYTGLNIEFLRWVFNEQGIEVGFKPMTFSNAVNMTLAGEVDAVSGIFYSRERDRYLDFSYPIYEMHGNIFVHSERFNIRDISDLHGNSIAVLRGDYALDYLRENRIVYTLVETNSLAEAVELLVAKKVDAIIGYEPVVLYHAYKLGLGKVIRKVDVNLFTGSVCIAVKEGNTSLINTINRGIERGIDTGKLADLYSHWLGITYNEPNLFLSRNLLYLPYILGAVFLLFLSVWIWNFRLSRIVSRRTRDLVEANRRLAEEIQERTTIQGTLQESENRMRNLGDNLTGGAIFQIRRVGERNYRFTYISASVKELIGLPREQVLVDAESVFSAMPDDDRIVLLAHLEQSAKSMKPINLETRFIHISGSTVWLRISASPHIESDRTVFWDGFVLDTTQQKQAEEERSRLAQVVEQADEIILIMDTSARVTYGNPAFLKAFGMELVDCIGQSAERYLGKTPGNKEIGGILTLAAENGSWRDRFMLDDPSGTHLDVEVTITPIRHRNHEISGYLAIERNITRELALERQLRQAQKMEAIGTLAGGIAHDFNNILSAVLGFVELALYEIENDKPVENELKEIQKAGVRARELVQQILSFSRQKEMEKQPVLVSLILKETLKILRPSLPSTISIDMKIESADYVLADPTQIHQVIMNLCTNAYHAMKDKGGKLRIHLDNCAFDDVPDYLERIPGASRYLRLRIEDTGHGISPEIRDRIFEPYFTTKPAGEGSGIGLSIVHSIVKNFQGDIDLWSELGQGTRFTIYFPVTDPPPDEKEEESDAEVFSDAGVLFVDDEESIVKTSREVLGKYGFRVCATCDSLEAWQEFSTHPDSYDILVTDMTMPGLTGIELAQKVLGAKPGFPVILCTGYNPSVHRDIIEELGIREILIKPFHVKKLAETIVATLEHHGT